MRITGTLHSIGHHRVLMPGTNTSGMNEADMLKNFDGVLVNTEAKAIGMIGTTVDIYPHPVNGLVAGECTPENYAHALARLAHTEDHLARETRSSQALAVALEKLQAEHDALAGIAHDLRTTLVTAEALAAGVRREAAAWLRILDAPPYFYGLSYESIARCIESGLDPEVIARETA